jgi:hypothetical protein
MFGWHHVDDRMPEVGLLVQAKLRHGTTGGTLLADLKHVHEDDCAWRFETGDELSYDWDVTVWRYKGCWLVLFLMWLGLLPGHHSHDPRLRTPEMEVWLTEEAARQRRNKILARKNLRVEQKGREKQRRLRRKYNQWRNWNKIGGWR